MNVLQIGTADTGGAATAALTIHEGIRTLGHQSKMLVGYKTTSDIDIGQIPPGSNPLIFRMRRFFYNRLGLPEWRFYKRTAALIEHPWMRNADIIMLHNLHSSFFDYRALPILSRAKPIVWGLHDMWALTGYCPYPYTCERWVTGCHHCPFYKREGIWKWPDIPVVGMDQTRLAWRTKRKIYRQSALHVVTSCQWMKRQVERSILSDAKSISVIHDGVDTEIYRPLNKSAVRAALQLPADGLLLLTFPSRGRKGGEHLVSVLNKADVPSNTIVLSVGNQTFLEEQYSRFPVRSFGYIHSPEVLNLVYNAADLFILPTLADNVPLSITAALAAGLPSAAYDVGGVSEIVRHEQTGYLARYGDISDLAHGIETLSRDRHLRETYSFAARDLALKEFSAADTARNYLALYEKILADARSDTMPS